MSRAIERSLALAACLLLSCDRGGQGLPPLPEFATAQRAVWQRVPADAMGGVVIADVGHLLGRLRALRAVLSSGPATKGYLDRGAAIAQEALGFDPLDDAGWRKAGLDPSGPLAVVLGPHDTGQVLFRASDAAAAVRTATEWHQRGDGKEPFDCAPAGELFRCGSPGWALPTDAGQSLWPHVERNLTAAERGMELVAYAPLDQGEAKARLDRDHGPIEGLHAGFMTMTLSPERLMWRGGATADDFAQLLPYLTPRPGAPSLLGLAAGGVSAGRMTFSPDALWALVQRELGKLGAPEAGVVNAVAGFDLEKDVVQNLTGEVVLAGYRSDDRTAPGGGRRAYADRLGWVGVAGTRDDAATRKVADRLGEMIGGAIGTFGDSAASAGFRLAYRADAGDRKVHWFTIEPDAERRKLLGTDRLQLFLTTVPGGLAIGLGPVGLTEVRKRVGKKASAMLDGLPLPEERALFLKSPLAFWGRVGEEFAFKQLESQLARVALPPEATTVLGETMAIFQLIYDGVLAFEIERDRGELVYQLSFL